MTRLGADATGETIAQLQALGVTFVSRYVSDFPSKNLTLAEAQRIGAAGIDLVTNWENDVNDWAGGYARGVAYATRALAQHKACGGPSDGSAWGIYFSVDEKVDPNSQTLHDYFRGVNSVLGPQHTGAYAQTSALRTLRGMGLIDCGERGGTWRSMSTFGLPQGLGLPGEFDVEQTGWFNAQYDRDIANSARFGQWRIGGVPASPTTLREIEMILLTGFNGPAVAALSGNLLWNVQDGAAVTAYKAAGVQIATIDAAEYGAIVAAQAASHAAVTLSDAQVAALGAAIAAGMPKSITLTGSETVTETGTLK